MPLAFRVVILLTLFAGGSVRSCGSYANAGCKQRAEAYRTRVEQLRKDASEQLKIGIRSDVVEQFFNSHGIPFQVIGYGNHKEATGTIYVQGGCAPRGCGSEDALIGLRVELNLDGTVISEPVVGRQFTNCL